MIKLTENQLFEYMHCPALFEMRFVKKLPISEKTTISSLLSKVSNFFYWHLLNGKVCSLAELKRKWDSVCESHSLTQKEALEGMHEVAKFANWMGREQPVILDVNTAYTIVLGNVELSGNLSPIFKRDKQTEFVVTDFSKRVPDQRMIDMRIKYTLDAFVYHKLFSEHVAGIRIHSVRNDKDMRTTRMEADYLRMESTVRGIGLSIEQKGFYVRENVLCTSCPALQFCTFWNTNT